MGNLTYAHTRCTDRDKLESAVAKAVQAVFDAGPEDRESSRSMERAAVKALYQHVAEHGCGASVGSAIRCSFTLVAEAESAVAAGEADQATLLYREADRAYVAALGELTRLTEREADLIEPAFDELEMRLQPFWSAFWRNYDAALRQSVVVADG